MIITRKTGFSLAAAVALSLVAGAAAARLPPAPPSPAVTAALASPVRPAEERAKDAARKPADVLALAMLKPGDKVGDFVMGGGYFTRLLSPVVGPKGRVYAYQPTEFVQYQAKYGADQDAAAKALANVTPLRMPLNALTFPEPLDVILTVQNYHDLYLKHFPADTAPKVRAELFRALKPGGVLVVVDHSAADGSGVRDAHELHRIDRAQVIAELEAAGFRKADEIEALRNPADPRTANVFDPAIRGKTDQFAIRFVKPATVR